MVNSIHGDVEVSDACQIKDLDHVHGGADSAPDVSDACQIKDLDHRVYRACRA